MADISIKKYRGKRYIGDASPIVPAYIQGDAPPPNNPPGSGGGGNFVTLDTAQTITGAKTFNNEVLEIDGLNPVVRIKNTSNNSILNFRNVANEDEGGLELIGADGKLKLVTRVNNTDIQIEPHGTGSIILPNVASGTPVSSLGLDVNNKVVQGNIDFNPRVFVFDFGGVAGNPDVTGGGAYNIKYDASTQFTTMDIGDTSSMKITGKIQARNAPNLISSIGGSTSAGGTISFSGLGWNWSNGTVGGFEFEVSATRIGTSTYRTFIKFSVRIFDGTVTEVKQIWTDNTTSTGLVGGGVNGSLTVTFAEANVENELFLYSGIINIFKPTQS